MIQLRREDWQAMQADVAARAPQEACGLVAGRQGLSQHVYVIENELASPTRFRLNAQQQVAALAHMQRQGWELLAIYHSHPQGPRHPSQTDLSEASYSGVVHLIWSFVADSWGCRAFLLDGGQIKGVEYRLPNE